MSPSASVLLACFFFTWMGACANLIGTSIAWQWVSLSRSLIVFALVGLAAYARGTKFVIWKPGVLWVRSLAGSSSLLCTFYALTHLPVATALTLTNTFPIWVALLSWPMLGEWPSRRVWLGVAGGAAGVWLIRAPDVEDASGAVAVALFGALSTAVAMLGLHRVKGVAPQAIVVHFAGVSLPFCGLAFWLFDASPSLPVLSQPTTLWLLFGVGAFAGIGQVFLTQAFSRGSPARMAVLGQTQVAFAALLDVMVLGHTLEWETLAGMALIAFPTVYLMLEHRRPHAIDPAPVDTTIPFEESPE